MINLVLSLCMTFGPYTEDIKDLCVDSYSIEWFVICMIYIEKIWSVIYQHAKDDTIVFYWYIKDCLITSCRR